MPEIRKGTIRVSVRPYDAPWAPVGNVRLTNLSVVIGDVIPVESAPRREWITGTISEQIDDDWAWWAIQRALQRYRP